MSTQITWVSVVRRQKKCWNYASACSCCSLFQENLLVFFCVCVFSEHVVNRICRRRAHQTCGYRNDSQERMILREYLSSTTACIMYEGLSFSVDEILELSEGKRKRGMGASSAAYNLKDGAHFQSSSHSSSLLKSHWTGTPNRYALVAYLPNSVCLCLETLRLLIKRISFLAGELWALFSITKCQCAMGAHCC